MTKCARNTRPNGSELYKDEKVAEQSAEAWSKSSVTRALYFAKEGKWEQARQRLRRPR